MMSSNPFSVLHGLRRMTHQIGFSRIRDGCTPEDLNCLNLGQEHLNRICVTNRLGDLSMFQFKDECIPPIGSSNDVYDAFEELAKIRGCVFNTRTRKVLAPLVAEDRIAFGKPENISVFAAQGWSFHPFVEGSYIRFCYTGSEWISLTPRRIGAEDTMIPETHIKILDIMRDCCPDFNVDILDTKMVYVFLIVHPLNQIMNPVKVEESVVFIANIVDGVAVPALDQKVCAIKNMHVLPELTTDIAAGVVAANGWILCKKGNHIFRYGAEQMEHLVRIRHLDDNPFYPFAYMYLRLNEADRKILPYAVPFVTQQYVSEDFMTKWLQEKSGALLNFFVMAKIALSENVTFGIKFDLRKIVNNSPPYHGDRDVLKIHFIGFISNLLNAEPIMFYKLTKMVDDFNKGFHRLPIMIFDTPAGPIFVRKEQSMFLPVPSFSNDPTPKEAYTNDDSNGDSDEERAPPKKNHNQKQKKKSKPRQIASPKAPPSTPKKAKVKKAAVQPPSIKEAHREVKKRPATATMAEMLASMNIN